MATPEPNTIVPAAAKLIADCVGTWSANTNAAAPDDQYLSSAGEWVAGLPAVKPSYRQGGLAVAMAVAHVNDGGANIMMRPLAEFTVDWALSPAGRVAIGWCGPGDVDPIETMMFAQDLGTVILLLNGKTAQAKMDTWKAALREAADYLIAGGDTAWYANGNINLGYALVVYLAHRVLGDAKYDWRALLQFAETPTQHSGSGGVSYGLVTEQSASWQAGFDGCAFFTEQKLAGWPNGYDGEYTMVQLDVLTRLALLSGDARVLELTNMVLNKTLHHTNFDTWVVDCGLGTRHTAPAWNRTLTSPALHVVQAAGRGVPFEVRQAQWSAVEAEFRSTAILNRPNVVYYRGLGSWVGLVVLNDLVKRGVVPQAA